MLSVIQQPLEFCPVAFFKLMMKLTLDGGAKPLVILPLD
jgi:hypothetical protein